MFDRSKRVAIIREVEIGAARETMIRSVTWDDDPSKRVLIGYFPHLRMAAEVTWAEWRKAVERTGE